MRERRWGNRILEAYKFIEMIRQHNTVQFSSKLRLSMVIFSIPFFC
jgi:hypothetical protein